MSTKHRRPGPVALIYRLPRLTCLDWILVITLTVTLTRAATPRDPGTAPKIPWPDPRLRRETGELQGPDPALPYDPDLPTDSYRDVQGYECNWMTGAEAVQLPLRESAPARRCTSRRARTRRSWCSRRPTSCK